MTDRTLRRGVPRRPPARRVLGATVTTFAALLGLAASACASVLPATPSSFAGVLGTAKPGDVVELAAGNYGTFAGVAKPGAVTIRSASAGAATMSLRFSGASNLRLEGLTIPNLDFAGTTNNVTVAGSTFTGMAAVRAEQMVNANIVFDGNTHANINVCGNCYEGRLQVAGRGSGPAGVTVQNSRFGPGGDADGMQIGAIGVRVLNNEFVGIKQVSQIHTDSLQLYGARQTVISGNYFHDFDVAIMAPDGGSGEVISDNVFVGGGQYRPAVQLGSHVGTQFVHNTVRNIDVHMDRKTENPGDPSRDGVIRDNVFVNGTIGGYSSNASYCTNCTFSYNLFSGGSSRGTNAIVGAPVFAGGANPSSWAGFALANGSPGKGNASDGTDRGIRLSAANGPPGTGGSGNGGPPPAADPAPPPVQGSSARVRLPRRVSWARVRRGIKVRVTSPQAVKLVLRLSRKGGKRALMHKQRRMPAGTHAYLLRVPPGAHRAKKLVLRVKMTDASGATIRLRRTIRIKG